MKRRGDSISISNHPTGIGSTSSLDASGPSVVQGDQKSSGVVAGRVVTATSGDAASVVSSPAEDRLSRPDERGAEGRKVKKSRGGRKASRTGRGKKPKKQDTQASSAKGDGRVRTDGKAGPVEQEAQLEQEPQLEKKNQARPLEWGSLVDDGEDSSQGESDDEWITLADVFAAIESGLAARQARLGGQGQKATPESRAELLKRIRREHGEGRPTSEEDLAQAIAFFSSGLEKLGPEMLGRLSKNAGALDVFFQSHIVPLCKDIAPQQEMPDSFGDDSLTFVLRCQQLDQVRMAAQPLALDLLERAVRSRNLPTVFKILRGLQRAQEPGSVNEERPRKYKAVELIKNAYLYQGIGLQWVKLLLASGVFDVNVGEQSGLWLAALSAPTTEAMAALLEAGADPNRGSRRGGTPLHACIENARSPQTQALQMDKLRLLLKHPGIDPGQVHEAAGIMGGTPLHQAVFMRVEAAVEQLLKHPRVEPDALAALEYGEFFMPMGSPLAAAAIDFLCNAECPETLVRTLAMSGARLLLDEPGQAIQDCTDDISRLRHLLAPLVGDFVAGRTSDARAQQLTAIIAQARSQAL
ncbi:MAG: ankyrin repeat domain-containing protein [Kistimonas sp.]|nr:ankyrin repeat domain-containing protein [Kistimonas sp.]